MYLLKLHVISWEGSFGGHPSFSPKAHQKGSAFVTKLSVPVTMKELNPKVLPCASKGSDTVMLFLLRFHV